jgi:tRNA (cytidine/uridine-2'-O-)-methyltransferase
VLLSTKTTGSVYDFRFGPDDILVFGKESAGVPTAVAEA